MIVPVLGVERRLEKRYVQLVGEHAVCGQTVAAGLRALPGLGKAFASTQGMWRFLDNERVGRTVLVRPLVELVQGVLAAERPEHVLIVHDWSDVHYRKHRGKEDRIPLAGCPYDQGYELLTALVLSAHDGRPVAPVAQALEAADGLHATYAATVRPPRPPLDALQPMMRAAEQAVGGYRCVHIVDSEADAVYYLRRWARKKRRFVVRADWNRKVRFGTADLTLRAVADALAAQGAFRHARKVRYHGTKAQQWVAEAEVVLERHGTKRVSKDRRVPGKRIPGKPLRLRLVVARVFSPAGELLAQWLLLTNVSAEVPAATIALWYYWRWQVESYFKLIKSAGLHIEQWQQETAERIARRLLVASMACALVWNLARDPSPEAAETRGLLIRLSGRQLKRSRPFTEPALLAGLWVLLAMLDVLDHYDLPTLYRLADRIRPKVQPSTIPK